ncbi:MAG: NADH-quinone oxidoreductase subunit NuoK [Acidobacteriota bacterium]|nr:NADH-quinone oxidoreductase subunit NuoK [Acidobacteriota bacterium]
MVDIGHYLILSTVVFTIGVIGVLTRRNVIIILMSIELMLNAVNLNLIAFSDHLHSLSGQVFAVFVITVAAAEAAVGLGIVIALFSNKETVNVDEIDLMKG